MSAPKLKRVLRLPAVVFIAIGFTIGGGVFVFTGIVFKITGPALPIAYVLAVFPVFISMLPIAMLGSAIPTTGANYKYPSRMVSPGLAFVSIWVYAAASFGGQIPLYALGCARYIQVYFPGLSPSLAAAGILTLIYIVNLLGVKLAAQVQGLFVIILLAALLFYAVTGVAGLDPENFFNAFDKGLSNLLLGTALLTFTYMGANGIIELGGEIINPGRVIPRAFMIAFPTITVVYALVAIATVGAAPAWLLVDSAEPLITVGRLTLGRAGLIFFVTGGAVLALTTTLNALFIVGTKSLLIIVEDRLLPDWLGRLNPRFGTPQILLTIIWIFSIAGIGSGLSLKTLASYAALGALMILIPIQIAAIRLPKLHPERYQRAAFKLTGFWLWFCPTVGILMVVFFSLLILFDLKSPLKIGGFFMFATLGGLYYHLRKKYLCSISGKMEDSIKNENTWDD